MPIKFRRAFDAHWIDSLRNARRPPPHHGGANQRSGAERRRVLENARTEKRRFDPLRSQRQSFRKLNGRRRCADQRDVCRMIVTAGRNHRHGATVLGTVRIRVEARVQLRRSRERDRKNKCADQSDGDRHSFHLRSEPLSDARIAQEISARRGTSPSTRRTRWTINAGQSRRSELPASHPCTSRQRFERFERRWAVSFRAGERFRRTGFLF